MRQPGQVGGGGLVVVLSHEAVVTGGSLNSHTLQRPAWQPYLAPMQLGPGICAETARVGCRIASLAAWTTWMPSG